MIHIFLITLFCTFTLFCMDHDEERRLLQIAIAHHQPFSSPQTLALHSSKEKKEIMDVLAQSFDASDTGDLLAKELTKRNMHKMHRIEEPEIEKTYLIDEYAKPLFASDDCNYVISENTIVDLKKNEFRKLEGALAPDTHHFMGPANKYLFQKDSTLIKRDAITLSAWDVSTGKQLYDQYPIADRLSGGQIVVISPSDQYFCTDTDEATVALHDAKSAQIVRRLPGVTLDKARGFNATNTILLTALNRSKATDPEQIIAWAVPAGLRIKKFDGNAAQFNATLTHFGISQGNKVTIYDGQTLESLTAIESDSPPRYFYFSPDSQYLAVEGLQKNRGGIDSHFMALWDIATKKKIFAGFLGSTQLSSDCKTVLFNGSSGKKYDQEPRAAIVQEMATGQNFSLGNKDYSYLGGKDTQGNYLIIETEDGTTLRKRSNGAIIPFPSLEASKSWARFTPDGKRILMPVNNALKVFKLNPVNWDAVSPLEKMAVLIAERNKEKNKPVSDALMAHFVTLKELAQRRYQNTRDKA